MLDYELSNLVSSFCVENGVSINISQDMPDGYDAAYGTYDVTVNTLYFNLRRLENAPEYEVLFYLYHELRHAVQYLRPELFDEQIRESRVYVVLYDGTCFKLIENAWHKSCLKGMQVDFINAYLSLPYELDANTFAYEKVKTVYGSSDGLDSLYHIWMPETKWEYQEYNKLFQLIDAKIACKE